MNRSQRASLASRDRGYQRVGQLTRWTAAGGGFVLTVIGVVLAQVPAAASTPTTAAVTQQGGGGSGSESSGGSGTGPVGSGPESTPISPQTQNVPQYRQQYTPQYGGQAGGQGLQPPAVTPQHSYGGGSHVLSGGS